MLRYENVENAHAYTREISLDRVRHSLSEIAKVVLRLADEYKDSVESLETFSEITKALKPSGCYLSIKGRVGYGRMFKRLYLISSQGERPVTETQVIRGKLAVNGQILDASISGHQIKGQMARYMAAVMALTSIAVIVYRKRQYTAATDLAVSQVVEDVMRIVGELPDQLESLDKAIYDFNQVGGKFTRHYKILARHTYRPGAKNPLNMFSEARFYQVYGGNKAKNKRFTRPIEKISGVNQSIKLTREAIRGAHLTRFEGDYMKMARPVHAISQKVLILKAQLINIEKVTKQWHKQL